MGSLILILTATPPPPQSHLRWAVQPRQKGQSAVLILFKLPGLVHVSTSPDLDFILMWPSAQVRCRYSIYRQQPRPAAAGCDGPRL